MLQRSGRASSGLPAILSPQAGEVAPARSIVAPASCVTVGTIGAPSVSSDGCPTRQRSDRA
ncbi:MAG: hypothetical protein AAAB14_24420, partial [Ensifer adhaerens]